MSNKDKSLQEQTDKRLDQKLEQLFDKESSETTSSSLDASIMQMAQKQLDEKVAAEAPVRSWWQKITGRSFKYPMSIAAALLVTVGIARFMAHLGGVDVGLVQKPEFAAAKEQAASESIGVAYKLESKRKVATPKIESPEFELIEPPASMAAESDELVAYEEQASEAKTSNMQRQVVAQKKLQAEKAQKQAIALADEERILVTGSRVKRVAAEASAPTTQQDVNDDVSGADDASYGVLDEAVLGYPLPEVWLEQIEQALADDDEILALDEWGQFKRTYPDYKVADSLLEKIKSLQNLGKSN